MPTSVLALREADFPTSASAASVATALRMGEPSVVGRVEKDEVLLDPRTVAEGEDASLIDAVGRALGR